MHSTFPPSFLPPPLHSSTISDVVADSDDDLALFLDMQRADKEYGSLASSHSCVSDASDDVFASFDWDKNDYDWLMTPPTSSFINVRHGNSYQNVTSISPSAHKPMVQLGLTRSETLPTAESSLKTMCKQQAPVASAKLVPISTSTSSKRTILWPSTPNLMASTQHSFRFSTPTRFTGAHNSPSASTRNNFTSTLSNDPSNSSIRPSTPVRRVSNSARRSDSPDTLVKSSFLKAKSLPSKVPRPSSPAHKSKHIAVSPELSHPSSSPARSKQSVCSLESSSRLLGDTPSNHPSLISRRALSNPRGTISANSGITTSTDVISQPEPDVAPRHNRRLSCSSILTSGRHSSGCVNKDIPNLRNANIQESGNRNMILNRTNSGIVREGRKQSMMPDSQIKMQIKSAVKDDKLISSVQEKSGFDCNGSNKSFDMALRHMDISNGTSNEFQSFMTDSLTSSLYSVGSSLSPSTQSTLSTGGKGSSACTAYSEYSRTDDESMSEKGSIASTVSKIGGLTTWPGSPCSIVDNNDMMQTFDDEIERMSGAESPLFSLHQSPFQFDDFSLESILFIDGLNEMRAKA